MHIDNTEFVRRKTDYNNLCREIHLAYAELERINKANSKGKVYMRSFPACKEINLWTYWQGYNAMAPKILVIGQDFGCPFGGAFGEEADIIESIEKTEKDGGIHHFDVYADKKKSETDINLAELLRCLDCGYDDVLNRRYDDIFFTNICLGYRSNKNSGNFKKSWITEIEKNAYPRLLTILQPKVIVCLGKTAYESFLVAMNKKDERDRKDYYSFIDENNAAPFEIGGIPVFAFAHCGVMGTLNRNASKCAANEKVTKSLDVQVEDWKHLCKYL